VDATIRRSTVYSHQGDYAKALEWYYEALAISVRVFGTEPPDTAATYNNIALSYNYQRDYAKALEWYYKALAIYEKVLGAEHPFTATAYSNIALAYYYQRDYTKARDLFCRAVIILTNCNLADHLHAKSAFKAMRHSYKKAGGKKKTLKRGLMSASKATANRAKRLYFKYFP